MTASSVTGHSGVPTISRRQLFKGSTASVVACTAATAVSLRFAAAPAAAQPLPLSYKGMFNDIIDVCARYHWTTRAAVLSESRERHVVKARQAAMYISRRLTRRSLPEIGRRMGDRLHTKVLYSDSKITALVERDPITRQSMERLTDACLAIARWRIAEGAETGEYVG